MTDKKPGLFLSVLPIFFLVIFLIINVMFFADKSINGPNQITLLLAGIFTCFIGTCYLKIPYRKFEKEIVNSITHSISSLLILLVVGSLISLWILSGIVPTMIYYGLILINPNIFLPISCLVSIIVSVATGSSWSTTGTIGIALIGIGTTLRIPPEMTAGAVISGAYFGDKMSPLSDTTNLASAIVGTNIFAHIRHMMFTTVPSILIAMSGFTILSLIYGENATSPMEITQFIAIIKDNFTINPILFLPLIIVLILVTKNVAALPALVIGALLGVLSALIFQKELFIKILGDHYTFKDAYILILKTSFNGFEIKTGHTLIDSLLNRGGMASMLNTIWLIISAMVLGGALEAAGMLEKIASSILKVASSTGHLVGATIASCITLNLTASDQYLAILLPGRMFLSSYQKFGLHSKNLSRVLEDSATVTSVLIPWNSCGAYNSAILGVATFSYLPYCFFNLLSPIISLFLASMNIAIERVLPETSSEHFDPKLKPINQQNHPANLVSTIKKKQIDEI